MTEHSILTLSREIKILHTQGALKISGAKFCTELSGNFAEVPTGNLILWPL